MARFYAALVLSVLLCACADNTADTTSRADGEVRFAVLGDAPYHGLDFPRYRRARQELDRRQLDFIVHVGDILGIPCDEATYADRLAGLQALQHAVIYTPGDNEWADCHEQNAGGYQPLERLQKLREMFFANPASSLGQDPIAVTSQSLSRDYPALVENARWAIADIVFATVHLPGSWNAGSIFPSRSRADDDATAERTAAAVAWINEAYEAAQLSGARALVLFTHADMKPEAPAPDPYRSTYGPVLDRLQQITQDTNFPILLVHGDGHDLTVDHPLRATQNGAPLRQFTRLQVMGAPDIGWVEVAIPPGTPSAFEFTPNFVPWWAIF